MFIAKNIVPCVMNVLFGNRGFDTRHNTIDLTITVKKLCTCIRKHYNTTMVEQCSIAKQL